MTDMTFWFITYLIVASMALFLVLSLFRAGRSKDEEIAQYLNGDEFEHWRKDFDRRF